jgi:hypothetical protein
MNTSNTEKTIARFRSKRGDRYDYDKVVWVNSKTKVIITCRKHGDFERLPRKHCEGNECPKCFWETMKFSQEEFILRSNQNHDNKYGYDNVIYDGNEKNVSITCYEHGDFIQQPKHHMAGHGCPACSFQKQRLNTLLFVEKSIIVHGNEYNYDKVEYTMNDSKVIIICRIHGEFLQEPRCHLQGQGCPKCQRLSTEEVISRSNEAHNFIYDYSKTNYVNHTTKIIIICRIHGEFEQNPVGHMSGRGCAKCSHTQSKGECDWLTSLGIPDDDKHRYVYVRVDNKRFYLDGYDPATNTAYEFNGDYWHGNPAIYPSDKIHPVSHKTYGELHQRTLQKEAILTAAGFKVISIWESDWKAQCKKQTAENADKSIEITDDLQTEPPANKHL